MFGKLFGGAAAAGVLAAVLATGAMAAPAGAPTAKPAAHRATAAAKNVAAGTVTAVSGTQLTVKNGKGESQTLLRTETTVVVKGLKEKATWSEIEINSHVRVRYESRDGKLYAKRVHIGRAHLAGTVQSVGGNLIVIRGRNGKDVKITVAAATKYFDVTGKKQRKAGALSEIHAGMRLAAAGSYDASRNFDAAIVAYRSK
ncbi:MAG: DUF5666 domain-containing protein [Candidatus Dormibacteraeota bacterium]|nr:DUF5666 domain-containing protein [Candidatus Dormibacteraeota bacterium]